MDSNLIFLDTSALYAFFDNDDANHALIKDSLSERPEDFITSNYILDELITLFRVRKISLNNFEKYVESIMNEEMCFLLQVSKEIESAAWEIMKKYSDHNFSFTDCVSFALMESHNIKTACTVDKHFVIYGFSVVPVL